jgi:hypothetical protein
VQSTRDVKEVWFAGTHSDMYAPSFCSTELCQLYTFSVAADSKII